MAIRNIVTSEDEVLHKKSRHVDVIDKRVLELLYDMQDTLHSTDDGIGLAAPQVGVLKRCVVIDMGEGTEFYINPKLTYSEGSVDGIESCLSVPDIIGTVTRPTKVKVEYQNIKGEFKEVCAEGLLAVCLCHEIDHLNGILFIDKATDIVNQGE